MLAAKNGQAIETILANEYNQAALETRSIMLKQKALLKTKRLEVMVGSICSIISVVLE